jgi:hypothetical protein
LSSTRLRRGTLSALGRSWAAAAYMTEVLASSREPLPKWYVEYAVTMDFRRWLTS